MPLIGRDHRVVTRVETARDDEGAEVTVTHSFTELATGLHYFAEGAWHESVAAFVPDAQRGGATAATTPHRVWLAPHPAALPAFEVTTPDGTVTSGRLVGLAYHDRASGQTVILAEPRMSAANSRRKTRWSIPTPSTARRPTCATR